MSTKIKIANIIVCILCVVLALTAIIMGIVIAVKPSKGGDFDLVGVENLPNNFGDSALYVANKFFVDSGLEMPTYAVVWYRYDQARHFIADGELILGRGDNMSYYIYSKTIDDSQTLGVSVEINYISNSSSNFDKKDTYGGFEYQLKNYAENIKGKEKKGVSYCIRINDTAVSNESQMFLKIFPNKEEDLETQAFNDYCNKMFRTLVDNLVGCNR